jgi:hypothetical protein
MPDEMFTAAELAEHKRQLARLHESMVEKAYREAYARCAPVTGRIPKPSAVQELVAAWQQLWKWRRK